jgi:putative ABC transport system substrate-binding protein
MSGVSRREFMLGAGAVGVSAATGFGLVAGCGRLPWQGDQPSRVYRVGLLSPASLESDATNLEAFLQGLRERGYVEGQNVALEPRYADGNEQQLPALAAELVRLEPDVILTVSSAATLAAKNTTSAIPIVFGTVGNPVANGIVQSLARPGGNVTGLSTLGPQLAAKRLQLLKDAVPGVAAVTVVRDATPATLFEWQEVQTAGDALALPLRLVELHSPNDLEGTLQGATEGRASALLLLTGPIIREESPRIIEFAAQSRLPSMWASRAFVVRGGLMSYWVNVPEHYRRAAYYVDRILKGTKPADLPVEQPMTFEFVVNMKSARELGIIFPPAIQLQITEVIE